VPTNAFNSLDGLFCILLAPLLVVLWSWQARRRREPGELHKIAIGYLVTALANVLMVVPALRVDAGQTIGMAWPVALFALNALGFLYYWPTLLALYSRAAPAAVNSTMMGMLFFSTALGNILSGTLGGWWETMSHARFFGWHAALAFVPFVAMLLLAPPLRRLFAPPSAPAGNVQA
jgi:POT family proton-dependent oligopeptide transporter